MKNNIKTNVMRLLDTHNIKYKSYNYENSGVIAGKDVAKYLSIDEHKMFKTLVATSTSKNKYVFVIPVAYELDLKKAAIAVKEKSVEMILQKELLPLTGYVHGGCSPIGMKKEFITVFDETANDFETIVFSAGKIGHSVEVEVKNLKKIIKNVIFFDIKGISIKCEI